MKFSSVIGQEEVKDRLRSSVIDQRISHAQLFLGREGSGMLATALAYASYVLCEQRTETDSCGTCPACMKLNSLSHPDLHFSFPIILSKKAETSDSFSALWKQTVLNNPYLNLEDWYDSQEETNKQGVIGVKESDDIVKKLSLKSFGGGYKICVIWMPERMNLSAANKLLKIVEEPPDKTLFLFVAESYDDLLPTIVSRLQLIRFKPIPEDVISAGLKSNEGLEDGAAKGVAFLAEGNYRKALIHANQQELELQSFEAFRGWMRLCFRKDVVGAISWVDEIARIGRERQKLLLKYGLDIFRQCLVGNYLGGDQVKLVGAEKDFGDKFMPYIKGANISELRSQFEEASFKLERNASPKILFLDLSFTMFRLINQ